MFAEDLTDFFNDAELADDVTYSLAADAATHPTSAVTITGIFEAVYVELRGLEGLRDTFVTPSILGEHGGKMTHIDINSVSTDYFVRGIQPDGTGLYQWVLEKI